MGKVLSVRHYRMWDAIWGQDEDCWDTHTKGRQQKRAAVGRRGSKTAPKQMGKRMRAQLHFSVVY